MPFEKPKEKIIIIVQFKMSFVYCPRGAKLMSSTSTNASCIHIFVYLKAQLLSKPNYSLFLSICRWTGAWERKVQGNLRRIGPNFRRDVWILKEEAASFYNKKLQTNQQAKRPISIFLTILLSIYEAFLLPSCTLCA